MRPSNVFQLEMASHLADRRTLIIRLGFTLLLGLPFILIAMPPKIQVSGLLIIMIFITFFGAAVTFVRRRAEGHYTRLKLLPIPVPGIIGDMILAGVLIDFVQMGLLLALFMIVYSPGITAWALLETAGLFVLVILILNVLGILLAFVIKKNSEAHLFGALAAGFLAFISGLFPVPGRFQKAIEILTTWNPLSNLGKGLMALAANPESGRDALTLAWTIVLMLFIFAILQRTLRR